MSILDLMEDMERRLSLRTIADISGNVEVSGSSRGLAINVRKGTGASCGFLCISKNTTTATTIDVSAGYACYAGTFTELSDGAGSGQGAGGLDTITSFNGASGSWYASAKIDFATSTWSLVKSATVDVLPVNTDSVQHYVLGKVTVGEVDDPESEDPEDTIQIITAVEQYWNGGWCIYENRV